MSASSSLEDLIVKQTCRFINCKFDTASNEGPTDPNNPSDLYSLEFMNALFNDPERNICKILKKQISDHRGKRGYNNSEKRILLDFFRNVVSLKSHPAKQWTDLQHYLYFVYRYCMASKPDPEQKYLSPNFVAEARSIMSNLMKEDQVQLCLRVFSLIREYTVFAQVQHEKISDIEASIENLFYYYEAFLSATKNLCKIFPELEKLILNIYKLGWLDLNTSIFMYYFYETTYVQNVVRKFEQMKDNVTIKTTGIYTVLTELHKLWRSQMLGINSVIANKLGVTFKGLDNKMMAGHKNILSKNFWIDRSDEEKSRQDMALFDYQLFTLVGNKGLSLPDPTLDGLGECICEDCLIIKYRCLLNNSQNKFSKSNMRVSCRSCQQQVDLHHFQQHIHGHDNSELNHFKHLSNKKKYNLTEKNKEILRDPDPKIANEPPVFPDAGSDDGIEGAGKDGRKNDTTDSENSSRSSSKTGDSKGAKTAKCSRGTNTSNKTSGMTFPCGHSCKLEEELKSEFKKAYQDTCDHHKESKKCDCTFCEVFGSSSSHVHKTNETRNRLRIRLNQRNEKVKLSPKAAAKLNASKTLERKEMPVGTSSHRQAIKENVTPNCRSENVPGSDMNDIHGLLNFIEGTYNPDKIEVAGKKAAKKARQKMKREHERQEQEREERKIQAEIKRREEAQRRSEELARQLAEKARAKEEKKKKQKFKREQSVELMEQTIPAMVTIKRVAENNDSLPTVTITLKGSTPDQDKLLFTLVNGHGGKNAQLDDKKNKTETMAKAVNLEVSSTSNGKKKNKNKDKTEQLTDKMVTKELRLTLAVDPAKATTRKKNQKEEKKQEVKKEKKEKEPDFNIPMLKLPPGITITKVDGPMADRNYKANVNNTAYSSSIPVSKSGVIVVDTEKLIKQSNVNEGASSSNSKKSRKKKKKQEQDTTQNTKPSMVTLKNPIFQNARPEPEMPQPENNNQQASIFTNENGMVTIRSSRLQQSLPVPMANLLSGLKPVLEPKPNYMSSCNFADASRISPFNAQEILSGLPGIEITKVDKNAKKTNTEKKSRTAEVSIIPTTNGDKFNFDKDDLHYDNVFTPKDILEDDMDAEELELEAFKRFCQQSVPPKRKEKVAHLNVKDIVLKKKNDKVTA